MQILPGALGGSQHIPSRTKHSAFQRQGNDPRFDLRSELYRIAGVDLTDIPGVSAVTAQVILTEMGSKQRCWASRSFPKIQNELSIHWFLRSRLSGLGPAVTDVTDWTTTVGYLWFVI